MLEITVQYTEDDLARGNRFIFSKRWFRHKRYLLAYLLLLGVGMIVFAFAQPALDWRNTFVTIGVVVLLIFLSSFVLERIVATLAARQIFRNNPHVRHPQTYKFEDENLTITGELFDATLKWHGLVEASESDADFFLFISKEQAYVLPKRVIAAGQESLLREFLKTKLQDRARLN
jgi:hypothetical protein